MKHQTRSVNHYEDFVPGRTFAHHWGRTLHEAESISFATEYLLYAPQHFNRPYALHLGFKDLIVPAQLVFSVTLGMSVEDLSESGGPFLGADDIEFFASVLVGDTLYASSEVLVRRTSSSRRGYGVVEWRTHAKNQRGDMVIRFRRASLVRMRAAEGQQ